MSTPTGDPTPQPSRRLSPEQVRSAAFDRSPLGRRGFSEDQVHGFAHRLAEEIAARDDENLRLLDENRRLKQAMRDWQSDHKNTPSQEAVERVTASTAVLMARAQQHIDAQIAQAELYCRQREQEAMRRYDDIVRHARQQARQDAERVAQQYRATSGPSYSSDEEQVRRQQVYLGALLQALDALASHVQATRQAFTVEVDNLAGAIVAVAGAGDGDGDDPEPSPS